MAQAGTVLGATMMERSVSASTTGSCSTTSSTSGPPTPHLEAASECLDWAVTRFLLGDDVQLKPSAPMDIPGPKTMHPHLHASDAFSNHQELFICSSSSSRRTADVPIGSASSLMPVFSASDGVEVETETTLERLERVVFLESDDSFATTTSSPGIMVSISAVTAHSSPVHLPMHPPGSASGPRRTRLRSGSASGSSSVISILASALPTTTAATLGPAFGVVFGAVAGGSGNLFDSAGAKKAARNAYGAPDLQVYLANDFGSVGGRTNRKRIMEQRQREAEVEKSKGMQHEEQLQQISKATSSRKPELRRHTVTGQRSDHVRLPYESLPCPRKTPVAPATPPTRAMRNRAIRFAHTPPAPRIPSAQRRLLARLTEALGSNVRTATPSDIERTLDSNSNASMNSDSFTSTFSNTHEPAEVSCSGIVATSKTAEALRAVAAAATATAASGMRASSTASIPLLASGLGKAWEPNETLPRSPSLSPESSPDASAPTAQAVVAAAAHERPTFHRAPPPPPPPFLLRSAAWGDASDADAAPPRRQRKSVKVVVPMTTKESEKPAQPREPPVHSTPPPLAAAVVTRHWVSQEQTQHSFSTHKPTTTTATEAEGQRVFRKPKRLGAVATARPVSTTALSLLDCWADFSGVWV